MGFYNYRFLNKEMEIIYVGKTKQELKTRIRGHLSAGHLPKECYEELNSVEYVEFETEADMDFMEIYFINNFRPKYNKANLSSKSPKIRVDFDFEWLLFMNIKESAEVSQLKAKIDFLEKKLKNNERIMKQLKKENDYVKTHIGYDGAGFKIEKEIMEQQCSRALDIVVFEVYREFKLDGEINPAIAMIIDTLGRSWFLSSKSIPDEIWNVVHERNKITKSKGIFDSEYIREAIQCGVLIKSFEKGEV